MAGDGRELTHGARVAFGQRVRHYRSTRGLSQEALALQSGLHRTYISSLERGQRNVSLDNIHKLAEALGVLPSDLLASD
jgi:transcriptional regulator with XRE-family HTH domain